MKLIEAYSDFINTGAIFTDISKLECSPEWLSAFAELDVEYIAGHSGLKTVSPLVTHLLNSSGVLDSSGRSTLAHIAFNKFGREWQKIFEAVFSEYNPIENYSMTETETPAETTVTETPAETTVTETPAETTVTDTPTEQTVTNTTENKIYGFDSTVGADSNKSTTTNSNDVDTAGTVKTETDAAGTVKTEIDTAGTVKTETDTPRKLTRSGNIGVTTSQQMIQSSLDLYGKYNFVNAVFRDIDSLLTLKIYE